VLRNKLWHMLAGKKYRRVSVWGLSPASPPANFACHDAREPRQDELSGDGVRGGAPAENGFSLIWSPQIASESDDSKFFTCVLKWWYGTFSPKSGGTLRLCYASSRVNTRRSGRRECSLSLTLVWSDTSTRFGVNGAFLDWCWCQKSGFVVNIMHFVFFL